MDIAVTEIGPVGNPALRHQRRPAPRRLLGGLLTTRRAFGPSLIANTIAFLSPLSPAGHSSRGAFAATSSATPAYAYVRFLLINRRYALNIFGLADCRYGRR